jgi:hypothetical protein
LLSAHLVLAFEHHHGFVAAGRQNSHIVVALKTFLATVAAAATSAQDASVTRCPASVGKTFNTDAF